jgi:hypothetical protein
VISQQDDGQGGVVYVQDSQGFQGVPQMQRSDRADLIDKIKPDAIIETIRHRLMGEELLDGSWVKNPNLADRALSELGAWELSNLMLGTASINVSISKLDDDEIKMRARAISKSAIYNCVIFWKSYGINSRVQIRYVNQIIFTNALVVLKQADAASIQELLKGTVQENRNINSEVKPQSRLRQIFRM